MTARFRDLSNDYQIPAKQYMFCNKIQSFFIKQKAASPCFLCFLRAVQKQEEEEL